MESVSVVGSGWDLEDIWDLEVIAKGVEGRVGRFFPSGVFTALVKMIFSGGFYHPGKNHGKNNFYLILTW